jgi:hypothetical protein
MARSPNKTKKEAPVSSPPNAKAGNPTQDKFGKAFNQVGKKTFEKSSVVKGKVTNIDVDYEVLAPLGTCLITFSQRGKTKHAYVYPLLTSLTNNAERVYQTLRVFMQAALFCADTPDRKLKKSEGSTIDIMGLVINFDHEQDHVKESNISANLLKVVEALVKYANTLAHRAWNGEARETFTYRNEFRVGNDFTRTKPLRRHLGQVISPEDSVTYMERMFESMTFHAIVNDQEIMAGMYGSLAEANALVRIARPEFTLHGDGNGSNPDEEKQEEDLPTFVAQA